MRRLDDITIARLRQLDDAIMLRAMVATVIREHLGAPVTRVHVEVALAGGRLPSKIASYITRRVRSDSFDRAITRREGERRRYAVHRG